jgi:hypothetical protein
MKLLLIAKRRPQLFGRELDVKFIKKNAGVRVIRRLTASSGNDLVAALISKTNDKINIARSVAGTGDGKLVNGSARNVRSANRKLNGRVSWKGFDENILAARR